MEEHRRVMTNAMRWRILSLGSYHRLQIEDEALFLASRIAQYTIGTNFGEVNHRFFGILSQACFLCNSNTRFRTYQKELDKLMYFLRRALVEHAQLVKEKSSNDETTGCCSSASFWLWQVGKELKDASFELVSFMNLRMLWRNDFVACVHNAIRSEDFSQILDQIDAKVQWRFTGTGFLGVDEIAEVASDFIGIPVSWFTSKPSERYRRVQERLKKRFGGQGVAIDVIFKKLMNPEREKRLMRVPVLGLFLFTGPSCSGKAELARAIADELYDNNDENNRLIQVDMEIFSEGNSIESFVNSLAMMVKKKPCSVVLLDKVQKANSSVLDALVGLLKRSEAKGSSSAIDFSRTLVIMASDIPDNQVYEVMLSAYSSQINQVTRSLFRRDLLSLLDELVVIDLAVPLVDTVRLLLRGWAYDETKRRKKHVIVCPSTSALVHIASCAAKNHGENGEGLRRWMCERVVFPMISTMVVETGGLHGNIIVYVNTIKEIRELSFSFQLL